MNLALSNEEINAILESADSEFMTEEVITNYFSNAIHSGLLLTNS